MQFETAYPMNKTEIQVKNQFIQLKLFNQ